MSWCELYANDTFAKDLSKFKWTHYSVQTFLKTLKELKRGFSHLHFHCVCMQHKTEEEMQCIAK